MAAAAHHGLPMISMSGADIYSPYVGTFTFLRCLKVMFMFSYKSHCCTSTGVSASIVSKNIDLLPITGLILSAQ